MNEDCLYKSLSRTIKRYNELIRLNSKEEIVQAEISYTEAKLNGYSEEVFKMYGLSNPVKKEPFQSKSIGIVRRLFQKVNK